MLLLPKPVSIGHACLAQLFFSTTVAIVLFTSEGWRREPEIVTDSDSPSLRTLALAAPVAILIQLILGASARHQAIGIVPHMAGAVLVSVVVTWVTVRVLARYSTHDILRRRAMALLGITMAQVLLGIAAYMSRLSTASAPQPMPVMVGFTVAHVAAGALTLASSVVLAIQVFRNVHRPAPCITPAGAAVTP